MICFPMPTGTKFKLEHVRFSVSAEDHLLTLSKMGSWVGSEKKSK